MRFLFLSLLFPLAGFCQIIDPNDPSTNPFANIEKVEGKRFSCEGHTYLSFEGKGIVHDPRCIKCLNATYVIWSPDNIGNPKLMKRIEFSMYNGTFGYHEP